MQGKGWHSILVMEQDLAVKEALKGYFSLIRVKPGHGTEFLGSRILPLGLPADRDLYSALGYPDDYQPAEEQPDARLANLLEQAYAGFIREALFWQEQGYTVEEIEDFLVRIYKEQTGGSKLVAVDRKQRRERMKVTLSRLQNDAAVPQEIRQLAVKTLQKLSAIS